jgi:DNA repair protein RadC
MPEIPFQRVQLVQDGSLNTNRQTIDDADQAKSLFADYFRELGETRETLIVATLDASNNITGLVHVSTGTVNASIVHPREVFRVAVMNGATSIIAAHNHPSGDNTPSDADLEVTQRLIAAGKVLGIALIDHIIVGDKVHSLREAGLIDEMESNYDILEEPVWRLPSVMSTIRY